MIPDFGEEDASWDELCYKVPGFKNIMTQPNKNMNEAWEVYVLM
jgi:hypothetical protein